MSTPGMKPEELQLMWIADLGLWAHFSKRPVDGTRWVCWFGTRLPNPNTVTSPSIEINISVDPTRKSFAGRAFRDHSGRFYVGHKGMLGGGRGGQMNMEAFAANLRGFSQEVAIYPNGTEEKIFNIGELDSPSFLNRLRQFVHECERLRQLARAGSKSDLNPPAEATFDPENDRDGFGYRSPELLYRIRREHGRVVNAL